jgi:hypothetical protein
MSWSKAPFKGILVAQDRRIRYYKWDIYSSFEYKEISTFKTLLFNDLYINSFVGLF